jgi:hypothetical protein
MPLVMHLPEVTVVGMLGFARWIRVNTAAILAQLNE